MSAAWPDPATRRARFLDYLDARRIDSYDPLLEIQGTMALPDHLKVQGAMDFKRADISRLPEHMQVTQSLFLKNSILTALPATLCVGVDLVLAHSHILALPDPFEVRGGGLDLSFAQITHLPERLHVGGDLNLGKTPIRRLPRSLHVGGVIVPPDHLVHIEAFLQDYPRETTIAWPVSQHQRLALREQLRPYPDLWRVAESLGKHYKLHLTPRSRQPVSMMWTP